MNKNVSVLILIGIILGGCHPAKEKAEFSNEVICSDSISRELVVLNDTFLFSYPLQIELIDSMLLVLDNVNNNFFHLFTLKGIPVKSFGEKGQGPADFINVGAFNLSEDGKNMYAYDSSMRKIVKYDVSSFLKDSLKSEVMQVNYGSLPHSEVPTIIYDMLSLKDSDFLVKANHKDLRFGLLKDGKITQLYNSFSDCLNTNNEEEVWSVFCSNTKTKLKPDRTKMLNATYLGGILELFDLDENCRLSLNKTLYIYEPKYGIAEGAIPAYVVSNETTQIGFEDVYATNNSIYALLHNRGSEALPSEITVFSWQGLPTSKIKANHGLVNIAVDEKNNLIYVIAENEQNAYELSCLSLN